MSPSAERLVPRTAAADAWHGWVPHHRATLVFVIRDGRILLIRKQRGLGAGKINGPGGKLDPGETFLACAIREVEEELCVTPLGLEERGTLYFQFVNGGGYGMEVRVFVASGCRGEPRETPEAIPLWTSLADIPYDEMWADDRVWLPLLLAGQPVRGRFIYDGDAMLEYSLDSPHDAADDAPGDAPDDVDARPGPAPRVTASDRAIAEPAPWR